ncbi:hypothetical protein [Deinococcus sp. Marseille-Q6407]|uniref:hypothetical protein n=1 Tax=Deinococcus sp. Marseille-Q6407 TaxID=2969223 RepID=UPI0021BF5FA6|nr:hypothetical protein [Deinococcus sp. Marseille-Q6407]
MYRRVLLLLFAFQSAVLAAPTVTTGTWGNFTLKTVDDHLEGDGSTLEISQSGKVKQRLSGFRIRTAGFPLRPGGYKELVVTLDSGGAHCCYVNAIYTQDGGALKLIGAFDGTAKYRDLDGDRTQEIIVTQSSTFFPGWSMASLNYLSSVWGWDKRKERLTYQTAKYPEILNKDAAMELAWLQSYLSNPGEQLDEGWQSPLSGYYTSKLLAGRKAEAESQIGRTLAAHPEMRIWFNQNRGQMEQAALEQQKRLVVGEAISRKLDEGGMR